MIKILDANAPIATVFGGSGFVGKYIVRRLVRCGWRIRVAVRNPNDAIFLKTYGEVGQVEVFKCSIFDQKAVSECMVGSKIVVNAVAGLLNETSNKMQKKYYIEGPKLIAKQCVDLKVEKLIHISSVGVNKNSNSMYSRSKAVGEEKIMEIVNNVAVVRPSLIFGHEDRFFNRWASLACYSLALPLIGKDTKFQPVYVDDVALAVEKIVLNEKFSGIFELGGPEVFNFEDLIKKTLHVIRRRRLIVNIPFRSAMFMAMIFETFHKITAGLVSLPFTRDNVRQLQIDNIVTDKNQTFNDLGINPQNIETIIPLYLYSYRPHGQYNDVTQSAKKDK